MVRGGATRNSRVTRSLSRPESPGPGPSSGPPPLSPFRTPQPAEIGRPLSPPPHKFSLSPPWGNQAGDRRIIKLIQFSLLRLQRAESLARILFWDNLSQNSAPLCQGHRFHRCPRQSSKSRLFRWHSRRDIIPLSRARSNLSGRDERDPPKSTNWDAREGLKLVGGWVLPGPVLLSYNNSLGMHFRNFFLTFCQSYIIEL